MMTIRQEIENATTMAELKLIAKRLQLRKVPSGLSVDVLRQVLLSTVGDRDVYAQPLCVCGHTKKQHYMDNVTGESFGCKVPSCGCKRFNDALR